MSNEKELDQAFVYLNQDSVSGPWSNDPYYVTGTQHRKGGSIISVKMMQLVFNCFDLTKS